MPARSINDPQHWLDRAKEARALAEAIADLEAKRMMLGIADDYERTARPEPNSQVACLYHRSSGDGIGEAPRASFQAVCEQDRRLILGIAVTGMTFEIADRTRRRARFRAFASSPNVLALSPQDIARWWHRIQVRCSSEPTIRMVE